MRPTVILTAAFLFTLPALAAIGWQPVTPAEVALKTPKIDPSADAEAMFWDVRIEDRLQGGDLSMAMDHYIRIKIFTDRGKEQYSTVEIPLYGKRSLTDIAGRTIKPDGSVIDLKKDSIFDRDMLKTKGLKVKGKSLALPNVEVGDIIEYRYREVRDNETASHMRLYFQRELPIWRVTYHLKPLNVPFLPYSMRTMAFHCNNTPFEKEANGFYATTATDIPAFQHEPDMPPDDQLMSWLLIYYEQDWKATGDKFWKEVSKRDYSTFKPLMKADDLVKSTAAEVTSGAATDDDKLNALDRFCRTKVKSTTSSSSHMTGEERKAVKENKSPHDTLKQMAGTGEDITLLFAALANAAGFDARIARVPDRGDIFFAWNQPSTYFLRALDVAVKVGDKWKLFDPATPYLEWGMLRWQEEGQKALISDPKEGLLVETQSLPAARSMTKRRATLKLFEDGSLQGTVRYMMTGHVGRDRRARYEELGPAEQEEDWKSGMEARLGGGAEITDFNVQNLADPNQPLDIKLRVSIPGYAVRTGKRLLVQPAFFQHNYGPRYTSATRKWDIYFKYAWAEDDEVILELPEGWVLDEPVAPTSSKLGNVGHYSVELLKTTDGRKLIYRRRLEWGKDQAILLPVEGYPQVKKVFEWMQQQDDHTMSLKQEKAVSLVP
jgi:hypothetical protein